MVRLLPLLGFACLPAFAITPEELAAARALFEGRRPAEAQQAFAALAATDPRHPEVNYYLGQLANRRDDPESARRHFEAATAVAPAEGRHHHGLGDALGRLAQRAPLLSRFGLAKQCLAAYERAVELEPGSVEFRQSLFEYYRQAPGIAGGGYGKAEAQAAAIKRIDSLRGRIAFATLYAGEKKYDRAFAEFEEALRLNPDDYAALYQFGRLSAQTGREMDRGLAALRRCLELPVPLAASAPGHAAVHYRLGLLLERKADRAGARVAYEAALAVDPKYDPAAEALRKLL